MFFYKTAEVAIHSGPWKQPATFKLQLDILLSPKSIITKHAYTGLTELLRTNILKTSFRLLFLWLENVQILCIISSLFSGILTGYCLMPISFHIQSECVRLSLHFLMKNLSGKSCVLRGVPNMKCTTFGQFLDVFLKICHSNSLTNFQQLFYQVVFAEVNSFWRFMDKDPQVLEIIHGRRDYWIKHAAKRRKFFKNCNFQ